MPKLPMVTVSLDEWNSYVNVKLFMTYYIVNVHTYLYNNKFFYIVESKVRLAIFVFVIYGGGNGDYQCVVVLSFFILISEYLETCNVDF